MNVITKIECGDDKCTVFKHDGKLTGILVELNGKRYHVTLTDKVVIVDEPSFNDNYKYFVLS